MADLVEGKQRELSQEEIVMRLFSSIKLLVLILALIGSLNCYFYSIPPLHVYEGPHLSKKKVGTYYCARTVSVKEIDGRNLREIIAAVGYKSKSKKPEEEKLEVYIFYFLPGEHTIKVDFETTVEYRGEWFLKFSVEPGRTYTNVFVKKDEDSGTWKSGVYIKDEATVKIVSEVVLEEKE